MTELEFERMRELPALIRGTRRSWLKLTLTRELRVLTEKYRVARASAMQAQANVVQPNVTITYTPARTRTMVAREVAQPHTPR